MKMNTLESIREALPGYARDLALNLGHACGPGGLGAGNGQHQHGDQGG